MFPCVSCHTSLASLHPEFYRAPPSTAPCLTKAPASAGDLVERLRSGERTAWVVPQGVVVSSSALAARAGVESGGGATLRFVSDDPEAARDFLAGLLRDCLGPDEEQLYPD